ncbi:site-specific integrase [Deinococcus metallilatus]|uniref:Integrase n=1 Tax=Deinococcus metallilatus TaxID=1211322 RepID=A0AAJ5JXK5_9DEIO|nr:tyrosine-type recombinase/integrase [Deinococcus metallilatus]MBB5296617.1 integrase [Deinococcus metallilatus]QBY08364.1 site-specific integrase [Deinococcus metallilatus]RXJ11163.1 site-specific integrase [Deinococcus metallilatus]TLK24654.1 site-specific integrase [Deinococcus metallilatus]GMA17535.1 site-specific integrase [Deinococcus metallilatus]
MGLTPDGTPIRRSGTAPDRDAAFQGMTQALADHLRGQAALPDNITTSQWLERWRKAKENSVAAKTAHNYQQLDALHITPHIGRKPLQKIRPADLRGLYDTLKAKGLGDSMLRQVHNVLHGAFQEALRLELIMSDPTAAVRPGKVRREVVAEPRKALTAEEVLKLLPVLRGDRWGLVLEFMLHTGLRRGEACGLKWDHVDLEKGTVHIRENLVSINGKTQVSTPKTAKSARKVKLSGEALDCLRRQQAQQRFEREALSPSPVKGHPKTYVRKNLWVDTGYVFTGLTEVALNPENLGRYLTQFCEQAEIAPITVHGLRHTYASLMLRRGAPLEVVSRKLGHARPSFTADVYRTVYESEQDEWSLNLSDLVNARKAPREVTSGS